MAAGVLGKAPISLERHSVGATHGRSLGRLSGGVPIVSDLPPALSAMGGLWSDEGIPAGTCFGPETERSYRRAGVFYRCELCAGKKGA
jgi:hypothetical protein